MKTIRLSDIPLPIHCRVDFNLLVASIQQWNERIAPRLEELGWVWVNDKKPTKYVPRQIVADPKHHWYISLQSVDTERGKLRWSYMLRLAEYQLMNEATVAGKHTCPLCGTRGVPSAFSFWCENTGCVNGPKR